MTLSGPFKRLTAAVVSSVLLANNAILAHAQETNVWTQRRAAVARQFAALPAVPRPLQSVLAAGEPALPVLPSSVGNALLTGLRASPGRLQGSLRSNGDISVVHIQDVHLNAEAQGNIQATIENLAGRHAIDLIALEGAFEPIDLSEFRRFPAHDSVARATAHMLRGYRITGPIASAMAGPQELPPIVGVDDPTAYEANAEAYRRSSQLAPSYRQVLARLTEELEAEKSRRFGATLLTFDHISGNFHRGKTPLSAYLPSLARETKSATPNISAFLQASSLESSLDFQRVERERAGLIGELARRLSDGDYRGLADAASAYRAGTLTHGDFYRRLTDVSERAGISWNKFPAMKTYLRYVAAADAVIPDALIDEMDAAEAAVYSRLCRLPEERTLVEQGKTLTLAEKLLDFSLTAPEWRSYRAAGPLYGGGRAPDMAPFEEFYRQAERRDVAISRNLLSALQRTGAKRAVLVAGGFHATGVRERLENAGVTCLSFVPRVTRVDDASGTHSLSVIAREKTPLDRLFDDRKLFLSQLLSATVIRNEGRVLVDAVQASAGRPERMLPGVTPAVRREGQGTEVRFPLATQPLSPVLSVGVSGEGLTGPVLEQDIGVRSVLSVAANAFREEIGRKFWEGRLPTVVLGALILAWSGLGTAPLVIHLLFGAAVTIVGTAWIIGQVRYVEGHDNSVAPIRQRVARYGAALLFNAVVIVPMALSGLSLTGVPPLDTGLRMAASLVLSTMTHFVWSGLSPPNYRMSLPAPDKAPHPVLGDGAVLDTVRENFIEARTQRNFDPNQVSFSKPRAVFLTLATQNSADKIDYWFERFMATMRGIGPDLYIEIFVVVNGSNDETAERVRQLMARFKGQVRVTLIEEQEKVGQNGAFNYALVEERRRYKMAKEKNPDIKLYVQLADDDAYFPDDQGFLPDHPEELRVSPIESNIRLLEDPELATRIIGHPVKVISANPIAPPIQREPGLRGVFKYLFQLLTHARRGRYRISLAQVYGANTTLNIDDFPERFPASISAGDCFLCSLFYPMIGTNPYTYFEHAEPGDWQTFAVRYVRDILFHSQLGKFFADDPTFEARFQEFEKGRQASHARLTQMVYDTHPFLSVTGFLHWLNGKIKAVIAWRVSRGWLPRAMTDRYRFYRGTNVQNTRGERQTAILTTAEKGGFIFHENGRKVIRTDKEALWDFVLMAIDIDTNLDNELSYDEALKAITQSAELDSRSQDRLRNLLDSIWENRGVEKSRAIPILDFALALKESFDADENIPEYLINYRIFLVYQFAHTRDDWVLAYAAETRFLEMLRATPTPLFFNNLFDVIHRSGTTTSPVLVRAIMDVAMERRIAIKIGGQEVLVLRALGRTGWEVFDTGEKTSRVVSFTNGAEVVRLRQLHAEIPDSFSDVLAYDGKLELKILEFVPDATSFLHFLETDHPLDEWLEVTLHVARVAEKMHSMGMVHGDLRGPYSMIKRDNQGELVVRFMNPGAFEWDQQMTRQTDVFGLANMLYYGLTKRNAPFVGAYEPVRSVPENLNLAMSRALGKSARGDFADMTEFIATLEECRASLRDNMNDATGTLRRFGTRFPAVAPSVTWNPTKWDYEIDPTVAPDFTEEELHSLVRMLGDGGWATHRLATFLLIRHLHAFPIAAESVFRAADLENIFLPAEVVHQGLIGHMAMGEPVRIGVNAYVVVQQFNPRVFLALDSSGMQVILKVTDERELKMTREGLDRGQEAEPGTGGQFNNVLAFHGATGTMTLRFQPRSFEDPLKPGTPSFLLGVVESFIEAADRVAELESREIVHRDLYPGNLKRSEDGVVQLIDFGLAEPVAPESAGVDVLGLAQELHSLLTGTVRWIPRIHGLSQLGGPETPYIATAPGLLNRTIEKGIKRELSAAQFAEKLRLVRDRLQNDFEPYIEKAFGSEGLAREATGLSILNALQNERPIHLKSNVPRAVVDQIAADIVYLKKRIRADLTRVGQDSAFRALQIAIDTHEGQWRWGTDNIPYLNHVLAVTRVLWTEYAPGENLPVVNTDRIAVTVATALDHDVEEDVMEGDHGREQAAEGVSPEMARALVSERILLNVGRDVASAVSQLSKPISSEETSREEVEERYIRSLAKASPEAQLVKLADWHVNFTVLGVEYLANAQARESARRFFAGKIDLIRAVLPEFSVAEGAKLKLLRHIHAVGLAENERNRTFPGAEGLLVMTPAQEWNLLRSINETEEKVKPLRNSPRSIRRRPQTWGLWTRWLGISPDRAVRTMGPLVESPLAALAFVGIFGVLAVALPGLGIVPHVFLSALAAQLLYALPALTGGYARGRDGVWRLVPATLSGFFGHLGGAGLLFHAPLYLGWLVVSLFVDPSTLAVSIPVLAATFAFGVRFAVRAHAAHNDVAGQTILERLRGTPLNLNVDSLLPLRRKDAAALARYAVREALPLLDDDLTILAIDANSPAAAGDILAAVERSVRARPGARFLAALQPSLQGTDVGAAWAEAARRHPGQLLIDDSGASRLFVTAGTLTGFDMAALDRRVNGLIASSWLRGRPATVRFLSPERLPLLNGDDLPADSVLRRALFHFLDALLTEMTAAARFSTLNFITTAKLVSQQA